MITQQYQAVSSKLKKTAGSLTYGDDEGHGCTMHNSNQLLAGVAEHNERRYRDERIRHPTVDVHAGQGIDGSHAALQHGERHLRQGRGDAVHEKQVAF